MELQEYDVYFEVKRSGFERIRASSYEEAYNILHEKYNQGVLEIDDEYIDVKVEKSK